MAAAPGDWTDSSDDSDDYLGTKSVSSGDERGPCQRLVCPKGPSERQDSGCQTNLSGSVCYQCCYAGQSVTHHSETFRVDRSGGGRRGLILRDVECQTRSTGSVRTREEVDRLRLLLEPLPRLVEVGGLRTPGASDVRGRCDGFALTDEFFRVIRDRSKLFGNNDGGVCDRSASIDSNIGGICDGSRFIGDNVGGICGRSASTDCNIGEICPGSRLFDDNLDEIRDTSESVDDNFDGICDGSILIDGNIGDVCDRSESVNSNISGICDGSATMDDKLGVICDGSTLVDNNLVGICNRSTSIALITNAIPTLSSEMLSALSAVIFNMVEGQTNWDAIVAEFGIGARSVAEVGCNTDTHPSPVTVGVQAGGVRAYSHKSSQAGVRTANKHSLTRSTGVDASTQAEGRLSRSADASEQTDRLVSGSHKETQTLPDYPQEVRSMFHLSPLGVCILLLSSVHVLEIMNHMIFG